MESTCACVLDLGLEHSCPWPRECLSSERLSLASDFFCVLGLGLEPCVLNSTSVFNRFKSTPVLYVDDTCLNVIAHKPDLLETLMNQEMEIAQQWMLVNKLKTNASKSKAMVISPKIKKSMFGYSFKCGESLISVQQNVKYLHLNIDHKLNFKEHIKVVKQKAACAVSILAKSKLYLPQDILLQLYHAFIECHILYAITV